MGDGPVAVRITLTVAQWWHLERGNDLTCYWPSSTEDGDDSRLGGLSSHIRDIVTRSLSFDGKVRLCPPPELQLPPSRIEEARANIVKCSAGGAFSGTFRVIDRKGKKSESPMNCSPWPKPSGGGFLIPADVHAEFLFNKLFPMKGAEREKPHGAIVIAGATGCGKSVFASAFALRVMRYHIDQARSSNERFPHLVTYEDPIEGWNLKVGKGKKETTLDFTKSEDCLEYGFCVTSRQKTIDVKSLCAALLDARRQTPQCFYVGELRRPSEWKHVMDFAGSGHLIVVTTHAASVGESMSKILSGCHAKTPADRRQWAGFLRGIVHLEKPSVKYGNAKSEDIVLPSLWRGIGSARNSLVSTGLSSVIPNPQFFDSRVAYFESLLKTFRDRSSLNRVRDPRWNEAIKSKALELDTRELTQ